MLYIGNDIIASFQVTVICKKQFDVNNSQSTPYSLCFAHLTFFSECFCFFFILLLYYIIYYIVKQSLKIQQKPKTIPKKISSNLFIFTSFNDFNHFFWKLLTGKFILCWLFADFHNTCAFLDQLQTILIFPGQEKSPTIKAGHRSKTVQVEIKVFMSQT